MNKTTLFLITVLVIQLPLFAQKAKTKGIGCKYHHMRFPVSEKLTAKSWGLTVTEQTACQGAIPYRKMVSPLAGADERSRFYMNLIPSQAKYFSQTRDLIGNSIARKRPLTHFELNTGDLLIRNQVTDNQKKGRSGVAPEFYMSFTVEVPITLKATRVGDFTMVTIDTNANNVQRRTFRFPMDVRFSSNAPDIKRNGYPSQAELLNAWRKYGRGAEKQWRDQVISDFLTPIFLNYKRKYIKHEEYTTCKVYSDKNKKGGYDHMVEAAEMFASTIKEIDDDFKQGDYKKFYKEEYQKRFLKCAETWNAFLSEWKFDLITKDNLVSPEYRQKVLLNYIQALTFTAQFDKAAELIQTHSKQKIKGTTSFDLRKLNRVNTQLKVEYAGLKRRGFVE